MKMLNLINIGERAGSGVPNMVQDWTSAGYSMPVLHEETNPARATVLLPLDGGKKVREASPGDAKETRVLLSELSENERAVMSLAFREGRVTTRLVVGEVGISRKSASTLLKRLATKGHLTWVGASTHDPLQYYAPGE